MKIIFTSHFQAIVDLTTVRAEKMRTEMTLAKKADRREEWRAQMERERLDMERERFTREHGPPETRRTIRKDVQTYFYN